MSIKSLVWRTPPQYGDHWSFIRVGLFGLFVCFFDGRVEALIKIYQRADDDAGHAGPRMATALAGSRAVALRRSLAWARSIGIAVPRTVKAPRLRAAGRRARRSV